MIVFKDLISADEMMTDAFPQKPVIDDDGNEIEGLFEVDSAMMVKGTDNVDIGCGDAFGGGEEVDDSVEKVNNVIDSFKYTEVPFGSKTELRDYLKDYMKSVRAKLKEKGTPQPEIKQFMAQAPAICKFLLGKFSDMQTFAGESMTSEGGMAFGYYKEGAHNPTFVYISKALDAEKVRPILT
ncbi:unnamed protein product [Ascophyllum nodosum]